MSANLVATLEALIASVEAMTRREWELAKDATYIRPPALLYCLHGTGRPGELIAVNRAYRPLDAGNEHADYAADDFAHLHCADSSAVRRLALCTNPMGRTHFPYGDMVPIFVFLSHADSRTSYLRRLRALIDAVKGQQ